jgi:hypothetical protein
MTSERAGELILQERMRIDYKKRGANFWMVKTQSPQYKKRGANFWMVKTQSPQFGKRIL